MPAVSFSPDDFLLPRPGRIDQYRQSCRIVGAHLQIAPSGHRLPDEALGGVDQSHRLAVRLGWEEVGFPRIRWWGGRRGIERKRKRKEEDTSGSLFGNYTTPMTESSSQRSPEFPDVLWHLNRRPCWKILCGILTSEIPLFRFRWTD